MVKYSGKSKSRQRGSEMSHPDMQNGKILQKLFGRRHKDKVFWATLVTHWKILTPEKRRKMLAGAAFGLALLIVIFTVGYFLFGKTFIWFQYFYFFNPGL